MKYLPDIIDYNLKLLFVGFNPGIRSAETGHHYAGKNNGFWKLLFESGLTPYKFTPEEDVKLLQNGFGSTNIVSRPTKGAAEISNTEFKEGALILREKLSRYKPAVVCYVGIGVYRIFAGIKSVKCGRQDLSVVEGVIDYVCSSPSGLNRMPYNEQLQCFIGLRELLGQLNR
ncbi:MAG: mismatch-specific DNA-glycosylase [Clostridia bacterium]|nr:mismatch-specific DNA-glycosylase [Clostridia bacterium]